MVRAQPRVRRGEISHRFEVIFFVSLGVLALSSVALAQKSGPSEEMSAEQLVRATVANEAAPPAKGGPKYFYRSRKQTSQGVDARLHVETIEGMAALLIEKNSRPISDQQMREEVSRLENISRNGDEMRRKQRQEREDADHSSRIIKALPDAFLYQFDGTEPGTKTLGNPGDTLIRLKFRPKPGYSPPSHVEQILLGMQGNLLVDPRAHRIARINASLFREVSFGYGVLGHLDKGGTFFVEQANVGEGSWELTRLSLNLTGKIMVFKSLSIHSDEVFSDFRSIPVNTNFATGVDLLKTELAHLKKDDKSREASTVPRQ